MAKTKPQISVQRAPVIQPKQERGVLGGLLPKRVRSKEQLLRMTVTLPLEQVVQFKAWCAKQNVTMSDAVSAALREKVA